MPFALSMRPKRSSHLIVGRSAPSFNHSTLAPRLSIYTVWQKFRLSRVCQSENNSGEIPTGISVQPFREPDCVDNVLTIIGAIAEAGRLSHGVISFLRRDVTRISATICAARSHSRVVIFF